MTRQHLLHPANVAVEVRTGAGVVFKIEPRKAHKERGRRSQLGQVALLTCCQVGPHGRQQPWPHHLVGQVELGGRRCVKVGRAVRPFQAAEHRHRQPVCAAPPHAHRSPTVEQADRLVVGDQFAAVGLMLGRSHALQRRARQHLDDLDRRVAHQQPLHRPAGQRRLDGEIGDDLRCDGVAGEAFHGPLHGQRARRRAQGRGLRRVVGCVEPAGDGVAGKADDAAALVVGLVDERLVDLVERAREHFGAATSPQRARQ